MNKYSYVSKFIFTKHFKRLNTINSHVDYFVSTSAETKEKLRN
jgi:hypothetical protein